MPDSILHISHTDIRYDSRILKQMKALSVLNKTIIGIGVYSVEIDKKNLSTDQNTIITITLLTKGLKLVPRFFRHILNFFELNIKLIRHIKNFKPIIVHCHDTTVLPIGVIMGFFYKYKLFYDAHELESNRNGQSKFFSFIVLTIERILWSRIDAFISVSDSIINWYSRNLGFKDSYLILNSPDIKIVDQNEFKKQNNYFHDFYGIDLNRKIFIYLGIIGEGRGIQKYIEVFSRKDFNADIVFVGYGELTGNVIDSSFKCKNIHYHEPVKHDEVVSLVKSADFGLCFIENISLSDYYCLPNKLFEYAFSGLTIVGSNFPEIKKVVDNYNLGYTAEPEVNAICKLISDVVDKPRKEFKDLYKLSWKAQAEKVIALYSKYITVS
jgi:glycosyltransferase involved in cell wall biosynthesis